MNNTAELYKCEDCGYELRAKASYEVNVCPHCKSKDFEKENHSDSTEYETRESAPASD